MSKVKQEILAMLPVRVLKVPDFNGVIHDVLVDGDYDGEWFATFNWKINRAGYVETNYQEKQPDGS